MFIVVDRRYLPRVPSSATISHLKLGLDELQDLAGAHTFAQRSHARIYPLAAIKYLNRLGGYLSPVEIFPISIVLSRSISLRVRDDQTAQRDEIVMGHRPLGVVR